MKVTDIISGLQVLLDDACQIERNTCGVAVAPLGVFRFAGCSVASQQPGRFEGAITFTNTIATLGDMPVLIDGAPMQRVKQVSDQIVAVHWNTIGDARGVVVKFVLGE